MIWNLIYNPCRIWLNCRMWPADWHLCRLLEIFLWNKCTCVLKLIIQNHGVAQCLKIIQNVAFEFSILQFSANFFVLLKLTCLVTLFDVSSFRLFKYFFGILKTTFVRSKCKRSSQCRMRLFLWFSNTVCWAYFFFT